LDEEHHEECLTEIYELQNLVDSAWGIIANAYGGDWALASKGWKAAAERWRDKYRSSMESEDASA
jgi:hypothetical protein